TAGRRVAERAGAACRSRGAIRQCRRPVRGAGPAVARWADGGRQESDGHPAARGRARDAADDRGRGPGCRGGGGGAGRARGVRVRRGGVMRRLKGVGVAGGLATGRAVLLVRRGRALRVPVPPERVEEEVTRLDRARERSRLQIMTIRSQLAEGPGAELAPIFDAQLLMLDDPLLVGRARTIIREERLNAEWAVQRAFDEVEALFEDIDDPYLQDRRGDVADVAGRLRLNLRE